MTRERALGPPSQGPVLPGFLSCSQEATSFIDGLQFNLEVLLLSPVSLRFLERFWDPVPAWWPVGEAGGDGFQLRLNFLLRRGVCLPVNQAQRGSKAMKRILWKPVCSCLVHRISDWSAFDPEVQKAATCSALVPNESQEATPWHAPGLALTLLCRPLSDSLNLLHQVPEPMSV